MPIPGQAVAGSSNVTIFSSRQELGKAAAADIASEIRRCLEKQERVRIIFAAAPSQSEMLEHLRLTDVDWRRVDAFHMDEYIGLPELAPQRFGTWLRGHIFDLVPFGSVHLLDPTNAPIAAARRYTELLRIAPIDIVCCGIGSNGHLAFNDPPANFSDPETVKTVQLDLMCRQQQVEDGCFASVEEVPTHAITLTVPILFSAHAIFCSVPGAHKLQAVNATLNGPLTEHCPASILKTHSNCRFYLDRESGRDLC